MPEKASGISIIVLMIVCIVIMQMELVGAHCSLLH